MMKHIAVILLFFIPLFAFSQSKQSDEYYNKGVELYNTGKFKEAIHFFEQSAELDLQEMEEGDPRREYSSHWLSACYYKLGNISKAETIYPGEYMVPPVDRRLTLESDRMSVLAMAAMDNGDYQTAADYYLKMMAIEKQVESENHPWVANDYYYYALCLVNLGDYATAEKYMKQYADIYEKTYGSKSLQYAGAISELAELYSIRRKYQESVIYGKKVLEIYSEQLGKDNDDYLLSLSNTARYCYCAVLYQDALRYQKSLVSRIKPSEMEPSDYITCVNNLALYNKHCANYQEALKQYDIALQTAEKKFGKNSEEYISVLSDIACVYGAMGNLLKEIEIEKEVLKVAEEKFNSGHVHILTLVRLSESWMAIGALVEAKDHILKAYDIMNKKNYDKLTDEYLTILTDLMVLYLLEKDMQSVLKYCDEKRGIQAQMCGEESYFYLMSEVDYAMALGDLGDYDNAISMLEKTFRLMKKYGYKIDSYTFANLADTYHGKGDLNKAKDNYETAIQIAYADKDTIQYVISCSDLALVQLERGDLNSALSFFTDSTIVQDFLNQAQHISANNMSYFNATKKVLPKVAKVTSAVLTLANLPDEVRSTYKSCIQLIDSVMLYIERTFKGEDSFDYMDCVYNVAFDKLKDGNYDYVNKNIPLWFDWIIKYMRNNFSTMTAQERFNFQQMHNNKLDQNLLLSSFKTHSPKLTGIAYDGQLFVKGLSLNAEIEIQKLIEKNGDKRMKELYYKIRNDRGLLDKLYQMPKTKRTVNTDSLQNEIEKSEKALVASSKELGDYTKNLSISWQNVQNKLKDTDIAIEFGQFYESGRLFFVALVLKKGMSNPEIVELFKGQNIDSVLNTNIYTTPALFNSIWKPLQKYLTNVKTVYFSPSGKFHTIAIEYLPDENGEIFAKKYNVYRLSSTRELALEKKVNPNKKAAVYGGIRYDLGKEDWNDRKDKEYQDYAAELSAFRDVPIIDNKNLRSGAAYLKGTELEAQAIIPILRNNGYQVSENTDVFATEESFKKLSGSGIKILHIGTHGFYKEEDPAHQEILGLSADRQSKEDLSLSRSGLLLAGANSTLDPDRRNDIPEGMDDGILTAKEISRLDFKGLDLVVLSACQTGLGEVTSEGVFGLQRGFKKAGAQTIVMSLWSVDDNATQLLMTEFFKNLASGLSKREAFLSAQNTVKEKYPAPKYWAAFVMVDGIDN